MSNTPLLTHLSNSTKSHQENIFESQMVSNLQLGTYEGTVVKQPWECCIEPGAESLETLEEKFDAIPRHPFHTRVTEEHMSGCMGNPWSVYECLVSAAVWSGTLSDHRWPQLATGTSLFHPHSRSLGLSQHNNHCLLIKVSELGGTRFCPCCFYVHLQLLWLKPLMSDPNLLR